MDFHSMKRKELQTLCKRHGIRANSTNLEMANRLTDLFKEKENQVIDTIEVSTESESSKKVKKVRFSPENEVIEFTRSHKMKRSRRSMVLCNKSNLSVENVNCVEELNVDNVDRPVKTRSRGKKALENVDNVSKKGKKVLIVDDKSEERVIVGKIQDKPVGKTLTENIDNVRKRGRPRAVVDKIESQEIVGKIEDVGMHSTGKALTENVDNVRKRGRPRAVVGKSVNQGDVVGNDANGLGKTSKSKGIVSDRNLAIGVETKNDEKGKEEALEEPQNLARRSKKSVSTAGSSKLEVEATNVGAEVTGKGKVETVFQNQESEKVELRRSRRKSVMPSHALRNLESEVRNDKVVKPGGVVRTSRRKKLDPTPVSSIIETKEPLVEPSVIVEKNTTKSKRQASNALEVSNEFDGDDIVQRRNETRKKKKINVYKKTALTDDSSHNTQSIIGVSDVKKPACSMTESILLESSLQDGGTEHIDPLAAQLSVPEVTKCLGDDIALSDMDENDPSRMKYLYCEEDFSDMFAEKAHSTVESDVQVLNEESTIVADNDIVAAQMTNQTEITTSHAKCEEVTENLNVCENEVSPENILLADAFTFDDQTVLKTDLEVLEAEAEENIGQKDLLDLVNEHQGVSDVKKPSSSMGESILLESLLQDGVTEHRDPLAAHLSVPDVTSGPKQKCVSDGNALTDMEENEAPRMKDLSFAEDFPDMLEETAHSTVESDAQVLNEESSIVADNDTVAAQMTAQTEIFTFQANCEEVTENSNVCENEVSPENRLSASPFTCDDQTVLKIGLEGIEAEAEESMGLKADLVDFFSEHQGVCAQENQGPVEPVFINDVSLPLGREHGSDMELLVAPSSCHSSDMVKTHNFTSMRWSETKNSQTNHDLNDVNWLEESCISPVQINEDTADKSGAPKNSGVCSVKLQKSHVKVAETCNQEVFNTERIAENDENVLQLLIATPNKEFSCEANQIHRSESKNALEECTVEKVCPMKQNASHEEVGVAAGLELTNNLSPEVSNNEVLVDTKILDNLACATDSSVNCCEEQAQSSGNSDTATLCDNLSPSKENKTGDERTADVEICIDDAFEKSEFTSLCEGEFHDTVVSEIQDQDLLGCNITSNEGEKLSEEELCQNGQETDLRLPLVTPSKMEACEVNDICVSESKPEEFCLEKLFCTQQKASHAKAGGSYLEVFNTESIVGDDESNLQLMLTRPKNIEFSSEVHKLHGPESKNAFEYCIEFSSEANKLLGSDGENAFEECTVEKVFPVKLNSSQEEVEVAGFELKNTLSHEVPKGEVLVDTEFFDNLACPTDFPINCEGEEVQRCGNFNPEISTSRANCEEVTENSNVCENKVSPENSLLAGAFTFDDQTVLKTDLEGIKAEAEKSIGLKADLLDLVSDENILQSLIATPNKEFSVEVNQIHSSESKNTLEECTVEKVYPMKQNTSHEDVGVAGLELTNNLSPEVSNTEVLVDTNTLDNLACATDSSVNCCEELAQSSGNSDTATLCDNLSPSKENEAGDERTADVEICIDDASEKSEFTSLCEGEFHDTVVSETQDQDLLGCNITSIAGGTEEDLGQIGQETILRLPLVTPNKMEACEVNDICISESSPEELCLEKLFCTQQKASHAKAEGSYLEVFNTKCIVGNDESDLQLMLRRPNNIEFSSEAYKLHSPESKNAFGECIEFSFEANNLLGSESENAFEECTVEKICPMKLNSSQEEVKVAGLELKNNLSPEVPKSEVLVDTELFDNHACPTEFPVSCEEVLVQSSENFNTGSDNQNQVVVDTLSDKLNRREKEESFDGEISINNASGKLEVTSLPNAACITEPYEVNLQLLFATPNKADASDDNETPAIESKLEESCMEKVAPHSESMKDEDLNLVNGLEVANLDCSKVPPVPNAFEASKDSLMGETYGQKKETDSLSVEHTRRSLGQIYFDEESKDDDPKSTEIISAIASSLENTNEICNEKSLDIDLSENLKFPQSSELRSGFANGDTNGHYFSSDSQRSNIKSVTTTDAFEKPTSSEMAEDQSSRINVVTDQDFAETGTTIPDEPLFSNLEMGPLSEDSDYEISNCSHKKDGKDNLGSSTDEIVSNLSVSELPSQNEIDSSYEVLKESDVTETIQEYTNYESSNSIDIDHPRVTLPIEASTEASKTSDFADEPQEDSILDEVSALRGFSTAKKTARTILIHGTPNKVLATADMKENDPVNKQPVLGDITISRPAKRRALQDI